MRATACALYTTGVDPRLASTAFVAAALLMLLGACDRSGRSDAEDGGRSLRQGPVSTAEEESLRHQPCWRKERGGWHYGLQHCLPMGRAEEMRGVYITAFEESSFIAGTTTLPDPDDPRRYANDVGLEPDIVFRFAGAMPASSLGDAYALTFIGRRTRDPLAVDCQGRASFGYVVDRLLTARYLGAEPREPHRITPAEVRARPVLVRKIHSGVWGEREAEAVAHCGRARRPPLPSTSAGDQSR